MTSLMRLLRDSEGDSLFVCVSTLVAETSVNMKHKMISKLSFSILVDFEKCVIGALGQLCDHQSVACEFSFGFLLFHFSSLLCFIIIVKLKQLPTKNWFGKTP